MRSSPVDAWSGLELVEPLPGGARGTVILARRGATEYVVRVSGRGAEAVDWELDLQQHRRATGSASLESSRPTMGGATSRA
jgi:hypothetical protein